MIIERYLGLAFGRDPKELASLALDHPRLNVDARYRARSWRKYAALAHAHEWVPIDVEHDDDRDCCVERHWLLSIADGDLPRATYHVVRGSLKQRAAQRTDRVDDYLDGVNFRLSFCAIAEAATRRKAAGEDPHGAIAGAIREVLGEPPAADPVAQRIAQRLLDEGVPDEIVSPYLA